MSAPSFASGIRRVNSFGILGKDKERIECGGTAGGAIGRYLNSAVFPHAIFR